MIRITSDIIDPQMLLHAVHSTAAGAVVLFLGTTREFTRGRQTSTLYYECYPAMAEAKLRELAAQAWEKWALTQVAVEHRVGEVPLGEVSVAIAVSAAHRGDAFAAGQWLIDTLKQEVPIWKREQWADGSTDWVHPGLDSATKPEGDA